MGRSELFCGALGQSRRCQADERGSCPSVRSGAYAAVVAAPRGGCPGRVAAVRRRRPSGVRHPPGIDSSAAQSSHRLPSRLVFALVCVCVAQGRTRSCAPTRSSASSSTARAARHSQRYMAAAARSVGLGRRRHVGTMEEGRLAPSRPRSRPAALWHTASSFTCLGHVFQGGTTHREVCQISKATRRRVSWDVGSLMASLSSAFRLPSASGSLCRGASLGPLCSSVVSARSWIEPPQREVPWPGGGA